MHNPTKELVLQLRCERPKSRAQSTETVYGSSSSVRRYTCVACREIIDTEAAAYPQTKHAKDNINRHRNICNEWKAIDNRVTLLRLLKQLSIIPKL